MNVMVLYFNAKMMRTVVMNNINDNLEIGLKEEIEEKYFSIQLTLARRICRSEGKLDLKCKSCSRYGIDDRLGVRSRVAPFGPLLSVGRLNGQVL